jgi:hypothetical protein
MGSDANDTRMRVATTYRPMAGQHLSRCTTKYIKVFEKKFDSVSKT